MESTKEKIAIMQAYADGKTIEFNTRRRELAVWAEFHPELNKEPSWNWERFNYRIKTKEHPKQTVPYSCMEQFLEAQRKHGLYLRIYANAGYIFYLPTRVESKGIWFYSGHLNDETFANYEFLAKFSRWLDGSPCGKEVEV